ncbi:MAG: putative sulfate/molybdate transporter [Chloroflexota bacterium]
MAVPGYEILSRRLNPFRFNLQELGGALGDTGTLLPLMVALIVINRLNATWVLVTVGLFYIISGLYYRLPIPVQPLKAVAAIAIAYGLSSSVIGAAGIMMGVILLFLSMTNLIAVVVRLFPRAVVRGVQLSIGLVLLRRGVELALSRQMFVSGSPRILGLEHWPVGVMLALMALAVFILFKFMPLRNRGQFPPSLALLTFGLGTGIIFNTFPGFGKIGPAPPEITLPAAADFWLALTVLVIPQLPLTLGNAVVGTWDTARTYFGERAAKVTPRALTASMGLSNLAVGMLGAMPMCHGSGGLTAHYRLGARTGGAALMIGGLLLLLGVLLGHAALPLLSIIPLAVLGTLLAIVGVYHALLIRDLKGFGNLAVAGVVGIVTIALGNLAYGFAAGILLYYLLVLARKAVKPAA